MTRSTRTRFVFEGVGTRGDVSPLVELAAEMVTRGYECHLLANAMFGPEATARGIGFSPISQQTSLFAGIDRFKWENHIFAGLGPTIDHFTKAGFERTIVVNLDHLSASNLVCERHGIPAIRLHLSPFKIRSLIRPPWPFGANAQGVLGRAYLRNVLPKVFEAYDSDPRILSRINQCRASLGLNPTRLAFYCEPYIDRQIALFPSWYGAPAPDWPADIEFAGFPLPISGHQVPNWLAAFLQQERRPIIFTPGTGVTDASQFFEQARDCCDELQFPGVFLNPCFQQPGIDTVLRIAYADYIDLELLLRESALLVHHGGIGTVARALQAGIPQIVRPRGFDQPDNGRRVMELNVGSVVAPTGVPRQSLASAARSLLDSDGVKTCLRSVRTLLARSNGVDRCADVLEEQSIRDASFTRCAYKVTPSRIPATNIEALTAPPSEYPADYWVAPVEREAALSPHRVVFFVAWPEPGHLAAPLALARQIRARGDKVVFAGAPRFREHITSLGYEFCDLSSASDERVGSRSSVFSMMPGAWMLKRAVDHLQAAFASAVERFRPSLILLDSLYSPLCILAESHAIPSALYETDLPREFDPNVPPPSAMIAPDCSPASVRAIRSAWARHLWESYHARQASRRRPVGFAWSMSSYFPDALITELARRSPRRVEFNRKTQFTPVAQVRRIVFCPRAFDFHRKSAGQLVWVGPYIDQQRAEPDFEWECLPAGLPIVYCSFGTQSHRSSDLFALLQSIITVFSKRSDLCLVLSCPAAYHERLGTRSDRVILTNNAPQLALLRRSSLAITHGGFNTIKECSLLGVPMVVLPLSHDQPRNAALIAWHNIGVALDPKLLTTSALEAAVNQAHESHKIRRNCERMKTVFESSSAQSSALPELDRLMNDFALTFQPTSTPQYTTS